MHARHFAKMGPTEKDSGCMVTLIMGWGPSLLDFQEAFLCIYRQGSLPGPPSRHLISLLQQSSALPAAVSLECLGENKAWILPHLTNPSCVAQDSSISYLTSFIWQIFPRWFHEPGFHLETGHPGRTKTGKDPALKVSCLFSSGISRLMELGSIIQVCSVKDQIATILYFKATFSHLLSPLPFLFLLLLF